MDAAKNILIIGMFSGFELGYARHYKDLLENQCCSFDIVCFERYDMERTPAENEILFRDHCPTGGSNLKKIPIMRRYASFIRKLVKQKKYDGIIVLTTLPAVMLTDLLLREYRGKYIIDIRDYTYEGSPIYDAVLNKLIKGSYCTVLSSEGFKSFLPDSNKYVITHNIEKGYVEAERSDYFNGGDISIGFVGTVRYPKINKRLCDSFANNSAVSLAYYGVEYAGYSLSAYCAEMGYSNVYFGGKFTREDKVKIYSQIDLINSIYDTSMAETLHAVPNRFYDSAIYKVPIIVSKDTYLEAMTIKYDLGFAVDGMNDDIPAMVQAYIDLFDPVAFENGCMHLLNDVKKDMLHFEETIKQFSCFVKNSQ